MVWKVDPAGSEGLQGNGWMKAEFALMKMPFTNREKNHLPDPCPPLPFSNRTEPVFFARLFRDE